MCRFRLLALVVLIPVACGHHQGTGSGNDASVRDASVSDAALPDATVWRDGGGSADAASPQDALVLDSTAGDAGSCTADPTPPGASQCPAECSSCEAGNVCRIECGAGDCNDGVITCPPEYACELVCDGVDACDTSTLQCPAQYACSVVCTGYDACGDVVLECGSASCSIACSGSGSTDSCGGASVECGAGACTTSCTGQSPTVDCASSCDCDPC